MTLSDYLISDKRLRRYSPFIIFIFVLSIVLADLLFPTHIIVHWQMVALIGFLIVLPFFPLIKQVSYGDFEAQLGEQVEKAEKAVEEGLPIPDDVETSEYLPDELAHELYELFDISHTAALGQLRTEIEVVLREILGDEEQRPYSQLIQQIRHEEKLSPATIAVIEDVRKLANQAIHEKSVTVSEEAAENIIQLGIEALERLYYYKQEREQKEREFNNH